MGKDKSCGEGHTTGVRGSKKGSALLGRLAYYLGKIRNATGTLYSASDSRYNILFWGTANRWAGILLHHDRKLEPRRQELNEEGGR